MTSQPKTSLFEMAEAVGAEGTSARSRGDEVRAQVFEAAYLTLGLMSLDEEASRKFVKSIATTPDAKLLIGMLSRAPRKPAEQGVEAA